MIPDLHLVMHGVAIKKHADAAAVAAVAGLPEPRVAAVLEKAAASGRVAAAGGKYTLTPAGHLILAGEYSRFYDGLRADGQFVAQYERFEQINRDLKQLITDWQTIEIGGKRVQNDHSDAEYDERIIGRLGDLHERFEPILAQMAAREARLAIYAAKLGRALERAEDGDTAWVSDARIESYHTVWFEMHEDLLRIIGREREG